MYLPIDLTRFLGREEALKKIKRYDDAHTHTMIYRTNDWQHSWRVLWHLENILPLVTKIYQSFNAERARVVALVHDDLEIVTGDVQLYIKEGMIEQEKASLAAREHEALIRLTSRFPSMLHQFRYADLLHEAHEKQTLESQVVSYCDKFDGFGEALHEVFAGNSLFLPVVEGKQKNRGYIGRLHEFGQKYPPLLVLLQEEHPLFLPTRINFEEVVNRGKPHTTTSLQSPTYAPYDFWKQNIIAHGHTNWLLEQKEFLKY